jgi:hypothetical protein
MMNLPPNNSPESNPPADGMGGLENSKLHDVASATTSLISPGGPCGSHLPTCAPDAFIAPTTAELHAHWPVGIKGFKPMEEWRALCHWLSLSPMKPALN